MLNVHRVMKAMDEMNAELLLRKPHSMRPMEYSLKLVGSRSNKLLPFFPPFYFSLPPCPLSPSPRAPAGSKADKENSWAASP